MSLISALCRHYQGTTPDYWLKVGRRRFNAFVKQANRELEGTQASPHSWRGTDEDPGWQAMREKRERYYGR